MIRSENHAKWLLHMNHLASGDEYRADCPICGYDCANMKGQASINNLVRLHTDKFRKYQRSGVKRVKL